MKYWRDCVNNKLLKCRILLRCEIFYIETRRKEGIGMDIFFFFFSLLETRESYLTHMFDTMFNVSREKRSTCRIEEILCAMLEQGWHSSCLKCASCSMYFAQRFQITRIISNENYYSIHFHLSWEQRLKI